MIFIDSDAYIASFYINDIHHEKAHHLFASLSVTEQLVTSWEVIDEVATKLSRFAGKTVAQKFLDTTISSDTTIVCVTSEMISSITTLFTNQSSKNVSLTDCANMSIARELKIHTFFSFDHHYEQNGFRLLK